MASLLLTYVLWLFGGIWGAHHWYLGRDNQYFLWFVSCGGFTLGWLRDFFRIPGYVKEANLDYNTMQVTKTEIKIYQTPSFKWTRAFAQFAFGNYFGYMLSGLFAGFYYVSKVATEDIPPRELHWEIIATALFCVGCSVGVHITGETGVFEKGSFWSTLKGAVIVGIVCVAIPDMRGSFWPIVMTATICWNRSREWNKKFLDKDYRLKTRTSCCGSGLRLFGKALIFGLLFTNWAMFSVSVEGQDGETIVLVDSFKNMLKSPAFTDFWRSCQDVYQQIQQQGWGNLFKEILKHLDADGMGNSFSVLGLDSSKENDYTIGDIKKAHRKLALEFHPDKQLGKTKELIKENEEKFREIQEAYEKLQKMYKRKVPKEDL